MRPLITVKAAACVVLFVIHELVCWTHSWCVVMCSLTYEVDKPVCLDYFISFFYAPFSSVTSYTLVTSLNSNFNHHRSNYLYSWLPTRSSRGVVVIEFASNPVFGHQMTYVYWTLDDYTFQNYTSWTFNSFHSTILLYGRSCTLFIIIIIKHFTVSKFFQFFRNDHRLYIYKIGLCSSVTVSRLMRLQFNILIQLLVFP